MAKEIIHRDFVEHLAQSKIVKVEVESEIKKSFIAYAMAVNVSRAIPDVRDGLKPVHISILVLALMIRSVCLCMAWLLRTPVASGFLIMMARS